MPHENSLYPAEWTRIAEKDMRRGGSAAGSRLRVSSGGFYRADRLHSFDHCICSITK